MNTTFPDTKLPPEPAVVTVYPTTVGHNGVFRWFQEVPENLWHRAPLDWVVTPRVQLGPLSFRLYGQPAAAQPESRRSGGYRITVFGAESFYEVNVHALNDATTKFMRSLVLYDGFTSHVHEGAPPFQLDLPVAVREFLATLDAPDQVFEPYPNRVAADLRWRIRAADECDDVAAAVLVDLATEYLGDSSQDPCADRLRALAAELGQRVAAHFLHASNPNVWGARSPRSHDGSCARHGGACEDRRRR